MNVLGIDIGGTSIKGAVINDKGVILDRFSLDVNKLDTPEYTVGELCKIINKFINDKKYDEPLVGIGIGTPGIIDYEKGIILSSPNLPTWSMFKIKDFIYDRVHLPIEINNDANLAALGESTFGSGKEYNNMIMLTLGTGVGSGIIINKKIYDGNKHQGAEIGHMVIKNNGRLCGCGRRGCLEAYASASALIKITQEEIIKHPDSLMNDVIKELGKCDARVPFIAAKKDDKVAKRVINRYVKDLSEGILNICNIFRPEAIILSGGVANEGEYLLTKIKRYVKKHHYGMLNSPVVDIKLASLGYDSGKIGAAALILQSIKSIK